MKQKEKRRGKKKRGQRRGERRIGVIMMNWEEPCIDFFFLEGGMA